MRTRSAALVALLALVLTAAPAAAVTRGGVEDNGEHPYVGQLLFYVPDAPSAVYPDPGGWFNCSGTLVNSRVVVTAGHCTFAIGLDGESTTTEDDRFTAAGGNGSGGNDVWITFAEEADYDGFPATAGFDTQAERYEARAEWLNDHPEWHRATSFPHPQYDDRAFFLHDAGVIVLHDAISMSKYGRIARLNYLQRYAASRAFHFFEVVGYGLNRSHKGGKVSIGGDTRMKAEPKLNNLVSNPKNTYIQLSNNPRTGGTCFGDSGGPTFDNTNSNLVVAVTSFGLSPNCTGIGGAYRLDQPDDLAFLASHGVTP